MHQSTATREIVLQYLYACNLAKISVFSQGYWQQFMGQFLIHKISKRKARLYVKTIFDHQDEIDELIKKHLGEDWSIERIHKVDLNILRMFIAEVFVFNNPIKVTINEMVQLAKKYTDDDSRKFINAAVDGLARNELAGINA